MLAIQKQPKYLEKAIQLPNGSWALVVFELVEKDGHIIAKAVTAKIIKNKNTEKSDVLCLPYIKSPAEFIPVVLFKPEFIQTFLRDYSFIVSQPTRAPSTC